MLHGRIKPSLHFLGVHRASEGSVKCPLGQCLLETFGRGMDPRASSPSLLFDVQNHCSVDGDKAEKFVCMRYGSATETCALINSTW